MATNTEDETEWTSSSADLFDRTIGCIEDIIIDGEFAKTQQNFLTKYCSIFENDDENKLIYTEIFNEYARLIENYLEEKLKERIPQFSMENLIQHLIKERTKMFDGEVIDILMGFTDFQSFKEMMIDVKQAKERNIDDLLLTGLKIPTHNI